MSITLHPGAQHDLEEAAAFYEREGSSAIAAQFLAAFERVAKLLLENPSIGTPRTGGRRGFPTTGFPYTVIYQETPTGIYVLVVKHDRRRRGYGDRRR